LPVSPGRGIARRKALISGDIVITMQKSTLRD